MDFSVETIIPAAFAAPIVWALLVRIVGRSHPPYPPGPKRYPMIGSVLSFPKNRMYEKFTEWYETYGTQKIEIKRLYYSVLLTPKFSGEIIYANVLGTPIIIVNSLAVAEDLCAKRSNIYSGRPRHLMMNELLVHIPWT
jgi:hypothetical protein